MMPMPLESAKKVPQRTARTSSAPGVPIDRIDRGKNRVAIEALAGLAALQADKGSFDCAQEGAAMADRSARPTPTSST